MPNKTIKKPNVVKKAKTAKTEKTVKVVKPVVQSPQKKPRKPVYNDVLPKQFCVSTRLVAVTDIDDEYVETYPATQKDVNDFAQFLLAQHMVIAYIDYMHVQILRGKPVNDEPRVLTSIAYYEDGCGYDYSNRVIWLRDDYSTCEIRVGTDGGYYGKTNENTRIVVSSRDPHVQEVSTCITQFDVEWTEEPDEDAEDEDCDDDAE